MTIVIDGKRPLTPVLNADGLEVGNARTYGDAQEIAQRYAAENEDVRALTWNQPVRFDVEVLESVAPVEPTEPVAPVEPPEVVEDADPTWVQLLKPMKPAGGVQGNYLSPDSFFLSFPQASFGALDVWRIITPGVFAELGGLYRTTEASGTFQYEVQKPDGRIISGNYTYAH